jgi:outer membrane receptor for ferrienterochelin and colicins
MKRLVVLLSLLLLGITPLTANADGVADESDLLFSVGAEAYTKGDFKLALEKFLASNRLVSNRNVKFNIARCYDQLKRYPDAFRYYIDALNGETDSTIRSELDKAISIITPRIAIVDVQSNPVGANIYIDRKDLGAVSATPARLGLADGTYKIIVDLPGYLQPTTQELTIKAGQAKTLNFELALIVGKVEFNGDAGTEVKLDDVAAATACRLPCSVDLPPGTHIAYYKREGFAIAPQPFTITANSTTLLRSVAEPLTGSLLISVDGDNALIEIDGKESGFAPTVISGVAVGKRQVRISLRGYTPIVRTVDINSNQQTVLRDLQLQPENSVSAASREAENIDDAPASVTVISNQELRAFAYPTVLEALRGVRGFAVNYDSVYGNAAVRGLGQANDFSNRLLVMSDGAVLNENILSQPFIHYDGRTDLGDVDHIEIVRGPSSVLYGTGAVSGVVNMVMRTTDEPDGIHGQVSSYDNSTTRARIGLGHHVSKDSGVWASFAAARSQGHEIDLAEQRVSNVDRFVSGTATGKAWWRDISLQWFYTSRVLKVPTGNYGSRVNDVRNRSFDRRFLLELKYDKKFSSKVSLLLRAHADTAYFKLDYFNDEIGGAGEATDLAYNYQEEYFSTWGGAEARLKLTLTPRIKFSVGGEATIHTRVNMNGRQSGTELTDFQPVLTVNAPYQVVAGSALLDWTLSSQWRMQAGARIDYYNLNGDQSAQVGQDNGKSSFQSVSPRFAVIGKPSSHDVIKVLLGKAFRAASAYELFYNDGGQSTVASSFDGQRVKPEDVYAGELEFSHKFAQRWTALASAHATLADNIVETVVIPDSYVQQHPEVSATAVYYRNSPIRQQILGGDIEVRREFQRGMMFNGQAGLLYGRYASNPSDDPLLTSRELPNAPTVFASVKGVVPIIPNTLNAALRAGYEDRRRIDTSTAQKSQRALVADFVLSGAIGRYGAQYAVGVYNMFGWQYALPANPYAANLIQQQGRTFMFSLTATR